MPKNDDLDELKEMLSDSKLDVGSEPVRTTFLLDTELNKRLNKLTEGKKRGFKTKFYNAAISRMLDELEKD